MTRISRKEQKEIDDAILHLWNGVDQAQIQELVEFAFKNCSYKAKKDILKDLYDYAMDSYKNGCLNPGIDEADYKEWINKAGFII